MGIRLTEEGYLDLLGHRGHRLECVSYGDDAIYPENIAIECMNCHVVLIDFDKCIGECPLLGPHTTILDKAKDGVSKLRHRLGK